MTWEQGQGNAGDCAFMPDTYCTVETAYMKKTHKGIYMCTHANTHT